MNNSEPDFGAGFVLGFSAFFGAVALIFVGFGIGTEFGRAEGESKMALLAVQAIKQIEKQLPENTKSTNPFTEEQLKTLSHKAQDILKLTK